MAATQTGSLADRIKAEFEAQEQRSKAAEQDRAKESQEREQRVAHFNKTCESLKAIWGPRLQEFAKQFGDTIKVTPTITPTQREVKAVFLTDLANITLTITVSASPDIRKLVLDYDLLILPMLLEYERHVRAEFPLDAIDPNAIGAWMDDRLVSCVKVYLSLRENSLYLKRIMVEDPITKATFLPEDAKAKLDHAGKTYYFSSTESLEKFKESHRPTPDVKAPAAGPAKAEPAPSVPQVTTKPTEPPASPARR